MGRRRLPPSPVLVAASARMSELAATQGGVVTAAQCRALGVDDVAVRRLLAVGTWSRARRGIYRDVAFVPQTLKPTYPDLPLRAASRRGPGPSRRVCRPAGLPRAARRRLAPQCRAPARAAAPTRFLQPTSRHHPPGAGSNERPTAGRRARRRLRRRGRPRGRRSAGARLVLDCCELLAPDSALAVADAALARELTTPAPSTSALYRRFTRLRAADLLAERVVERADPLAENWFESSSRWWLLEAGLPRPRLQVPFTDKRGRLAKVDMLFDRVVGEADGAGKYDEPGALFAEKQREDWLRDAHRLEVRPVGAGGDALAERPRRGRRPLRPGRSPGELICPAASGAARAPLPPARSIGLIVRRLCRTPTG